ncbi:MAG: four helix bundle protein [Bacteroidia bacterium]|jgi:four helix bundle protein
MKPETDAAVSHVDLKDRTKQFSLPMIKPYQALPKTTEAQIIGKQVLRSGTSVGANTRAAFRGQSSKEFKAKLGIVIEEADESVFWLEILNEAGILDHSKTKDLKNEADQLVSIFVSIVKR